MPADSPEVFTAGRAAAGACVAALAGGATGAGTTGPDGAAGATFGASAGVCNNVAPHIPQKRFVPGFSLPQRLQRTHPPGLSIAYDILRLRCIANPDGTSPKREVRTLNTPVDEHLRLTVQGRTLEVHRIPAGKPHAPELVFLHEGLGSISLWKDFPVRVAAATGCPVTIYSRYGNGHSDPLTEPRSVTYMHDEAIHSLPDLLTQLKIENPILIGHSDGGSIALIYAAVHNQVRGLVLLAPHVFVEDLSVSSIAEAKVKFETTNMPEKLARHHGDPAGTFWGWNHIWLSPDFRRWNIEEFLPRITCPILAIQGMDDQYGTMAQVEAIARQSAGPVELLKFPDCRHSAHRDQPEAVLEAITRFVQAW